MTDKVTLSLLMNDAYKKQSKRGGKDIEALGFVALGEGRDIKDNGYQAQAYVNPKSQTIVLSIAGSNGDAHDLAANVNFGAFWEQYHPQFHDNLKYANDIRQLVATDSTYQDYRVITVGHSLGGGLAQTLTHVFGWHGITWDAPKASLVVRQPGFQKQLIDYGLTPKGAADTFINYTESGSLVSALPPAYGDFIGQRYEVDHTSDFTLLLGLPAHAYLQHRADNSIDYFLSEQDANVIDGWHYVGGTYDGWYSTAPRPEVGQFDWVGPASAAKNAALDLEKTRRIEHNQDIARYQELLIRNQPAESRIHDPVFNRWNHNSIFNVAGDGALTVNAPYTPFDDLGDLFDAEERMLREFNAGWITAEELQAFQDYTLNHSLGSAAQAGLDAVGDPGFLDFLQPIGAFYDSQSPEFDQASSIAQHTGVLLDGSNAPVSEAGLQALDTDGNGELSLAESTTLTLWQDRNEDGHLDAGEQVAVSRPITAIDYPFHTRGNAHIAPAIEAEPARPNSTIPVLPAPLSTPGVPATSPGNAPVTAPPALANTIQAIPASNYRSLRGSDNVYYLANGRYILWGANQIKINYNNRAYLIGTDGNDRFDANYYAAYAQYFNLNLLTRFLAGNGDDLMGGSARADSLWGGLGHDILLGYAGNDKLYGESGQDQLQGQDGNDYLDGGDDNDALFGQDGDDVLHGGSGQDRLDGGAGGDTLDGGTEADTLLGGTGDDTLAGGAGADELQGNEGHDRLLGGAGADRLFGQVGNDTLWGGAGDDLLMGFTGTNEAKQTLAAGETDDDTLHGGAGHDNLYGGLGADRLDGGEGNDILLGNAGHDRLWGAAGNDELQGNQGDDQISGGAGQDRLFGQVGDDTLWGGTDSDLLVGFTASNEAQQTLAAGETDNDTLYGGAGGDFLLGGLGNDRLHGGDDKDELQGGDGADRLYGEHGDDNLFGQVGDDVLYGQVGDDVLYGGEGDDFLMGFTASNEWQQVLIDGQSDNDHLYGGAGRDTLLGGPGRDYLDGGAGADEMAGGAGDDTYIVNSVNDSVHETANAGYDRVITNTHYLLNAHIEELRLLEGFAIHGTGNAQDNTLIGNSADNILDGVTGADTLIGGAGDDTYYVDNSADVVEEHAGQGLDTVQSSIDYALGGHVENLILLDYSTPEKGRVDGREVLVYGYPKRNELDYLQGDAVQGYAGTCALTAIANLLTQSGRPTSENEVVTLAIANNWAVNDPDLPAARLGGSNVSEQRAILDSYGIANEVIGGYNEAGMANLLRGGRAVILAVNAGVLWDDAAYAGSGAVNHAVTVTGAVHDADTGVLLGFYIADSGRGRVSDHTRFINLDSVRRAAAVSGAYAIHTRDPVRLWDEDLDATGNAAANLIVGNRGHNRLDGLAGDDTLRGQAGSDVLAGGAGADHLDGGAGNDTLYGAQGDDRLYAGAGNNWLDGGAGSDMYFVPVGEGRNVLADSGLDGLDQVLFEAQEPTREQLHATRVGGDLELGFYGRQGEALIKDWAAVNQNWEVVVGRYSLSGDNLLAYAQLSEQFAAPDKSAFSETETSQLAGLWEFTA